MICRLCESTTPQEYFRSECIFYRCSACDLIFKDPSVHLSPSKEKERYLTHENEDTEGYRGFLNGLAAPLMKVLKPGARGLDFGCGPGPVLSRMLEEQGFSCVNYDPFFRNDESVLHEKYDFVTCSEVVEHFYSPGKEFVKLRSLLKPNGILAVMTQAPPDDFANWYYWRDPSHVMFYSTQTMQWIARAHSMRVEFHPKGVSLFT